MEKENQIGPTVVIRASVSIGDAPASSEATDTRLILSRGVDGEPRVDVEHRETDALGGDRWARAAENHYLAGVAEAVLGEMFLRMAEQRAPEGTRKGRDDAGPLIEFELGEVSC